MATPGEIVIHVRAENGSSPRVVVAGEVDVSTANLLADALDEQLETRPAALVVDMGSVEFIDAAAIGVLVDHARKAASLGSTLVVERPSRAVQRLFDLLGLNGTLCAPSSGNGAA